MAKYSTNICGKAAPYRLPETRGSYSSVGIESYRRIQIYSSNGQRDYSAKVLPPWYFVKVFDRSYSKVA